ncbi:MAG: glycosyltransferase family 4 protein, partial [Nitrospirota bacterium]
TFSIEKPLGGGQVVVSGLYKYLSNYFDVIVLSIVSHDQERRTIHIKEGLQNKVIPMSLEETKILWDFERKYGIGLSDFIHIDNISLSREYIEAVKQLADQSDVLIFEHPYLVNILDHLKAGKKIIYHAIDVEFLQKKNLYGNFPELLDRVKAVEARACDNAQVIFTTCEAEKRALKELYPEIGCKYIHIVPNGIDADRIPFITPLEHRSTKKNYPEFLDKTVCLFVGSWHPPNLEAAEFVIDELAPENIHIHYLLVGSVKEFFYHKHGSGAKVPPNVHFLGLLEEDEKWEVYRLADFAINPMLSGAGTNIKMLEYMAAGLPVITTPFGARGIDSGKFLYFEKVEDFFIAINSIRQNPEIRQETVRSNLQTVKEDYNFPVIAKKIRDVIYKELLGDYNLLLLDRLSDEFLNLGISEDMEILDSTAEEIGNLIGS